MLRERPTRSSRRLRLPVPAAVGPGGPGAARPGSSAEVRYGPARAARQGHGQQLRLIEASLSASRRSQGHRNEQRRGFTRKATGRREHQTSHEIGQSRPAAILEPSHQFGGETLVQAGRGGSRQGRRPRVAVGTVPQARPRNHPGEPAPRAQRRCHGKYPRGTQITYRRAVRRDRDPAYGAPARDDCIQEPEHGRDDVPGSCSSGVDCRQPQPDCGRAAASAALHMARTSPSRSCPGPSHLSMESAAWCTSMESPSVAGTPTALAWRVHSVPVGP